jgi:hypothetical protein
MEGPDIEFYIQTKLFLWLLNMKLLSSAHMTFPSNGMEKGARANINKHYVINIGRPLKPEEGSIVQHSYRVWNPHEISQAH